MFPFYGSLGVMDPLDPTEYELDQFYPNLIEAFTNEEGTLCVPQYTTMYLASLQDLPASLYEAAEIDGADSFQKFRFITIPYLKPITTYVLLTGIIGTLQMFDQAYIFSNGSGGPANSTLTVSLMVYRYAFGTNNAMGYAASIAIILALVIMAVSLIAEKLNDAERWY